MAVAECLHFLFLDTPGNSGEEREIDVEIAKLCQLLSLSNAENLIASYQLHVTSDIRSISQKDDIEENAASRGVGGSACYPIQMLLSTGFRWDKFFVVRSEAD